jgi:hypothetical protein
MVETQEGQQQAGHTANLNYKHVTHLKFKFGVGPASCATSALTPDPRLTWAPLVPAPGGSVSNNVK